MDACKDNHHHSYWATAVGLGLHQALVIGAAVDPSITFQGGRHSCHILDVAPVMQMQSQAT